MIIRNADYHDICAAAADAGVLLEADRATRGTGYRVRLKLATDKRYQRMSHSGRRVAAVCWHGHRDFFRALYQRAPEARVSTGMADYRSAEDFEASFEATGRRNIGSQMDPVSYRTACFCAFAG